MYITVPTPGIQSEASTVMHQPIGVSEGFLVYIDHALHGSYGTLSRVTCNGMIPDVPIVYGDPLDQEEGVKENIIFYPHLMEPRRPYPFYFLDRYMLVRKKNNDLEVFYLEEGPLDDQT